jgi:hypothetical protein
MKHLLYVLLLTGLISCVDKVNYTSTKSFCIVDSVEYHGVGQDHSLQTTPYWNVHVKDSTFWIRAAYPVQKGDTMILVYRKYKNPAN